ncbi:MAG: hypothetical protein R2860_12255 [Desulfobacterales bacterium]
MASGKFHSMIIPIDVELADGTRMADTDQHPRPGTVEELAQLKPAFKENGRVTAECLS